MKVDVLTSGYVSMDHIIKIATPAKWDLHHWLQINPIQKFFTEAVL